MLISKPSLPRQLTACSGSPLLPSQTLENCELSRPNWSGNKAKRLQFDAVRLIEPDLTGAILREGGWADVEVSGGQLAGLDLTGSSLRRLHLSRARVSGAVFAETQLKDVIFADAKLDLVNFRFASFSRVSFIRCQMIDVDLSGAKLDDVSFVGCDLTSADYSGAVLRRVDLRGSTLLSVKGIGGLKGATISSDQMIALLPEFTAALGVEVNND